MISIETARQLLDFAGGGDGKPARISSAQAEQQLEGAVAIHNILEQHRVAYLADEVGMGKTYIALGAFALFRHFHPNFRMLVLAPKENIQQKWTKELRNFVRNNFRVADQRVKAIHHVPARPAIVCNNLLELVRETALDPDRDFFARLSSFSFGLGDDDTRAWITKRDELLRALPWLDRDLFDLHSKQMFKDNFARAICCALPSFDLVIVDEAHNLKGGLGSKTWRNRLLALAFGQEPDGTPPPRQFRHYGPRAKRVLMLSATPLEDDYKHVWNQLAVFGLEAAGAGLQDGDAEESEKKTILSRFLIRRVNELRTNGKCLTKNLYRREWRGGGVEKHDEPLKTPDERQQLVVALVQKKVSELLQSERFNNSFQIGMLASFESFAQTAKARNGTAPFDDAEQAEDADERDGIDVNWMNRLANSYWQRFARELPHPKMDALVQRLSNAFTTGEKSLVFVRRVASVKELQQKLETEYDSWLIDKLRREIRPNLQNKLEAVFVQYENERRSVPPRSKEGEVESNANASNLENESEPARSGKSDEGGNDTFFSWFFRGEGPNGILSGAELSRRLNIPRYALSSFFQDNWVAALLNVEPGRVFAALQETLRVPETELRNNLEKVAGSVVATKSRNTHSELFLAFQFAALSELAQTGGEQGRHATTILHQLFDYVPVERRPISLGSWLETPTFFTELRKRQRLRDELWPREQNREFVAAFRRTELRRELIASLCRLGHSLIDLWILYTNRVGRLETRAVERTDQEVSTFACALLDMLEHQRAQSGLTMWYELHQAAQNFDLILDTNAPALWERKLVEVTLEMAGLLGREQPIGGMSGAVNKTLVRQFRMPGYPLVLVTTDLLQEGEDLHLFCSQVYHYGISWMPSSMEQRIGRIDRVRSQTERKLQQLRAAPSGDDLLQVFYPFLRETVEVFQVERVFERLNCFMRLMHERFGAMNDDRDRKINVAVEAQRRRRDIAPLTVPLKSSFPVGREFLAGPRTALAVPRQHEQAVLQRFKRLKELEKESPIEWHSNGAVNAIVGTRLGARRQAFTLLLHSISGMLNVRCVSPFGRIDSDADLDRISAASRDLPVRIGAAYDARLQQYDLTAEGDVLLGDPSTDLRRVRWLLETVVSGADQLEELLFEVDADPAVFDEELAKEAELER